MVRQKIETFFAGFFFFCARLKNESVCFACVLSFVQLVALAGHKLAQLLTGRHAAAAKALAPS